MLGESVRTTMRPRSVAKFYNVGERTIEICVFYDIGGMNYFTGKVDSRGIFIRLVPVQLGKNSVTFTAFTGIKELVLPMKRFSAKKFADTVDTYLINPDSNETVHKLYNHITK